MSLPPSSNHLYFRWMRELSIALTSQAADIGNCRRALTYAALNAPRRFGDRRVLAADCSIPQAMTTATDRLTPVMNERLEPGISAEFGRSAVFVSPFIALATGEANPARLMSEEELEAHLVNWNPPNRPDVGERALSTALDVLNLAAGQETILAGAPLLEAAFRVFFNAEEITAGAFECSLPGGLRAGPALGNRLGVRPVLTSRAFDPARLSPGPLGAWWWGRMRGADGRAWRRPAEWNAVFTDAVLTAAAQAVEAEQQVITARLPGAEADRKRCKDALGVGPDLDLFTHVTETRDGAVMGLGERLRQTEGAFAQFRSAVPGVPFEANEVPTSEQMLWLRRIIVGTPSGAAVPNEPAECTDFLSSAQNWVPDRGSIPQYTVPILGCVLKRNPIFAANLARYVVLRVLALRGISASFYEVAWSDTSRAHMRAILGDLPLRPASDAEYAGGVAPIKPDMRLGWLTAGR